MEAYVTDNTWDGENHPQVYVNWLNQEIRVGDTVLYAVTRASSAYVVLGRILEFRTHDSDGKPMQRSHYDYVNKKQGDITHLWNFKIQPIKDSYTWSWRERGKDGDIKPVVVGTIHNITLVDASLADGIDA